MHLIVLVHLAELYFKTHEDEKIKKIIVFLYIYGSNS